MRRRGDDALTLTLFVLGRFSEMPDLLDFFEYDAVQFLKFIDRFGGMTLRLPDREKIGRMARNMNIYRTLNKHRSMRVMEELAREYGITHQRVLSIYDEVVAEVRKLDEQSGDDTCSILQAVS